MTTTADIDETETVEPGTELATVEDAEVEVPQALTEKQAKALDKRVRAASDKVSAGMDNLLDLLEQAANGRIHEALGVSWTAWFADAVQIKVSDRVERKELAKLMSGKGMSQRAIASSLGVSQKTIDRDLEGEEVEDGATVTSLDGAERPKSKSKSADVADDSEDDGGVIDAEVVEDDKPTPADDKPTPAAELVETFNDEVSNLWQAWSELKEHLAQPKWAGARKRVAGNNLNHLQEVISGLGEIVDDLMVGNGK